MKKTGVGKYLWFASVLTAFLFVTSCNQHNCQSYRNGKFKLVEQENGSVFIINRQDSIQTEDEVQTGIKLKFKVHWISDCQYTLLIIDGPKAAMDFYGGKLMTVDMLDTYDDGYNFSMKIKGSDQIRYGIMKKIK